MAPKTQTISKFLRLFTTLLYLTAATSAKQDRFGTLSSRSKLGLKGEKLSHLRFYFHDRVNGRNPTAAKVAEATMTTTSPTFFGTMVVIDDPLTVGPDEKSEMVGRARGMYASASQNEESLFMVINLAFTDEKVQWEYTQCVGEFRFARGYYESRTHYNNTTTGDAIVKFDVYVFHY